METDPVLLAQHWHDEDHGPVKEANYTDCWCCCPLCAPHPADNPYYKAAMGEIERLARPAGEPPR